MGKRNNKVTNINPWQGFYEWAEKAGIEVVSPDEIIGSPPEEVKLCTVNATKKLLGKVIKFPDKRNSKDYR